MAGNPNSGFSPCVRRVTASSSAMPSAAVGSGRLGIRSITSPMRASTSASRASSSVCCAFSCAWLAIGIEVSSPRCLASAIALAAALRSARTCSTSASSPRRAPSSSMNASTSSPAPRRASAARTRSVSERISLASIMTWLRLTLPGSGRRRPRPALPRSRRRAAAASASPSSMATAKPASCSSSMSLAPSPKPTTWAGSMPWRRAHPVQGAALGHARLGDLEEERQRLGDEQRGSPNWPRSSTCSVSSSSGSPTTTILVVGSVSQRSRSPTAWASSLAWRAYSSAYRFSSSTYSSSST